MPMVVCVSQCILAGLGWNEQQPSNKVKETKCNTFIVTAITIAQCFIYFVFAKHEHIRWSAPFASPPHCCRCHQRPQVFLSLTDSKCLYGQTHTRTQAHKHTHPMLHFTLL